MATLEETNTISLVAIAAGTPALGQALAAGSVPVVLTASQLSAISPIAGGATETTLAALNAKFSALGQRSAATSAPVTLSDEDVQDLNVIGQSGQINLVNNILTVVAGSAATDVNGYRSGSIELGTSGSVTGGNMLLECSNDNVTFYAIPYVTQSASQNAPAALSSSAINPSFSIGNAILTFSIPGRYIRLRISSAITGGGSMQAISRFSQTPYAPMLLQTFIASGQVAHSSAIAGSPVRIGGAVTTTLDTSLANGDTSNVMITTGGQTITKEFGSAENDWSFACVSGGIDSTAGAVTTTLKAAGAASIRNYVTGFDIYTGALGTSAEITIRDGSGGPVLWRGVLPTTGILIPPNNLATPLKGSAATAMVVTVESLTTTGKVYFNARGYQSF